MQYYILETLGNNKEKQHIQKQTTRNSCEETTDIVVWAGICAFFSYADGYQATWDQFFGQIEPVASSVPYMTIPGNESIHAVM